MRYKNYSLEINFIREMIFCKLQTSYCPSMFFKPVVLFHPPSHFAHIIKLFIKLLTISASYSEFLSSFNCWSCCGASYTISLVFSKLASSLSPYSRRLIRNPLFLSFLLFYLFFKVYLAYAILSL